MKYKGRKVNFTDEEFEILGNLGKKIKDKRKILKLSQLDLSKKTGIDRSYLSVVEGGLTNITYLKFKKIEEVLGEKF